MFPYSKFYPLFLRLDRYTPMNAFFKQVSGAYARANGAILLFPSDVAWEKKKHALGIANSIKRGTFEEFTNIEACQLFDLVEATTKIEGDIAEVGTYNGGSAKIICEAKGERRLHLFDTFEGIPEIEEIDVGMFSLGQYAASLETVMKNLKDHSNVFFYKGIFPTTVKPVEDKTFSFVHLDVDTYRSTLDCLEFFYPRMQRGGVILSHDYLAAPGVTKAFDEFFSERPEPIISLTDKQALIMKLSDFEMSF
jgi:O-methyltransferase